MVVELLDLYFPENLVLGSVLDGNRKITSVVESSEFTGWNLSLVEGTSSWLLGHWLFFRLIKTHSFSSETLSFLQDF